ncbi:Major facilitator superfamily domain, general substrate transporter [Penicillium italicum]|uniref:Major facilitator superfamily domain, general substrate transporter n=1 Tax=Penicillium italicum TaxID=40296 RepID=A0A0A2KTK7_PENIT|nr:Major facilitator superfamily domain, general substrate transporter [Penicillium italicum]
MVQREDSPMADTHGPIEVIQASSDDTLESALGITEKPKSSETWNWDDDPSNPYNWPTSQKVLQVAMIALAAFTTSVGVSILSPAHSQFMEEFGVSSTVAILPLSLYVLALALGPIVGGPLSETVGRYPVYIGTMSLGTLFTLGVGFCPTFAGICVLRFLAGFCYAPTLAIAAGTLNETFEPVHRALPSAIFILTPFLGPGLGPVIGSFVVSRKGWRWTQWTTIFFAIFTCITVAMAKETFHPTIKRRRAKELGLELPPSPPLSSKLRLFVTISLLRPIHMLVTEPIVGFICLYIACEFATLFSFFAAFPLIFQGIYHFNIEDSGLVFLGIVVGCLLGTMTVIICNVFLYLPKASKHPDGQIPPEYRLYPALIGSVGLPIGLFWFAWTARADISWASPVVTIVVFAWGNLCVFVSTTQYLVDTYHGLTVASAMSANGLARYGLAAAFPLFTVQMYTRLGAGWASSLLGFIAAALLPVPWTSPVFATCDIEYVPVSLRDLFQSCQNTPPIAVKNKFQWINRERIYWARRFQVPMSEAIPKGFPAPTSEVQLALGLVATQFPNTLVPIVDKLYRGFWEDGNSDVLTQSGFAAIFESELGAENAKQILDESKGTEAKAILDGNTQQVFTSGAFGLPWFDCIDAQGTKESFWGIDHLGRLVDFLQLDPSLDKAFRVLL